MANASDLTKPNINRDLLVHLKEKRGTGENLPNETKIKEEVIVNKNHHPKIFIKNRKVAKALRIIFWYLLGNIILGSIGIGIYIYIYYRNSTTYDGAYVAKQKLEVGYWECKSEIINQVEVYMTSKVNHHNLSAVVLLNACDKYDIDIRLPLSQGLNESHFGTAGLAKHTNSVFNVGAFDHTPLDKILGIYKYPHPNKSIEPYLALLRKSYLGKSKTECDLLNNFVDLKGRRYASYERYETELKLTWEEINRTTKLDSLLTVYRYLKVELGR